MSIIALMTIGSPAHATEPGKWNFQVYGGWYAAGDLQKLNDVDGSLGDTLEALGLEPGDDLTFGARIGKRFSDIWGFEFSAGYFDVDEAAERLENQSSLDMSLGLFDLSLMLYPAGGGFYLYGGGGAVTSKIKLNLNDANVFDESETAFSLNAGLGYVFNIGQSSFIRLDGKARWYDLEYYEGPDAELTAAWGWNF